MVLAGLSLAVGGRPYLEFSHLESPTSDGA